jgi:hypothetical protein
VCEGGAGSHIVGPISPMGIPLKGEMWRRALLGSNPANELSGGVLMVRELDPSDASPVGAPPTQPSPAGSRDRALSCACCLALALAGDEEPDEPITRSVSRSLRVVSRLLRLFQIALRASCFSGHS